MIIAAPLLVGWTAAVLLSLLDGKKRWVAGVAVAGLVLMLVFNVQILRQVSGGEAIEVMTGGWPVGVGIRLHADALGALFAVFANFLLLAALLYEAGRQVEERSFPALILFLALGLNGLFLTGDIFNFYVFFEIAMTASYVIAAYGKGRLVLRNTLIFVVVNLLGSVLFLMGIGAIYHLAGSLDMAQVHQRIGDLRQESVLIIGILFLVAFGVKLGLFPFHAWLPPVYRGVRPVSAAILSGVLANIGSYGLLRFGGGILSNELQAGADLLIWIGVVGMLYGAVLAVGRRTAQEVLAYSSISQAGYILIALSIGGAAGFTAAILVSVANALNKTLLFLASGLKGRIVSLSFAIGAFSLAGVPPAFGFFPKTALLKSAIFADEAVVVGLILLGGALSFLYMFQIYHRGYLAIPQSEQPSSFSQQGLVLLLALVVIVFGLWPGPLLAVSQRAAEVVLTP